MTQPAKVSPSRQHGQLASSEKKLDSIPSPPAGTRLLDLPGMRAYIDQQGIGPDAVFVHGLEGDTGTWTRLWEFLGDGRSYLRYDLRDFGQSTSNSDREFTHSADLMDLLDALQIEDCDLIGASMGGGVALNFALNHPTRVRSLTLISPQILGWEWSDDWQKRWQPIVDFATAGRLQEARELLWEHPMFASTRETEAAIDLHEEIGRFEGRSWKQNNHALVVPDIERVHELQTPTLLLSGLRDVDEFHLMADIVEASVRNLCRHDLPGGHLLQMELPELCARHIQTFLDAEHPRFA